MLDVGRIRKPAVAHSMRDLGDRIPGRTMSFVDFPRAWGILDLGMSFRMRQSQNLFHIFSLVRHWFSQGQ
jgi:hypothetical protein